MDLDLELYNISSVHIKEFLKLQNSQLVDESLSKINDSIIPNSVRGSQKLLTVNFTGKGKLFPFIILCVHFIGTIF